MADITFRTKLANLRRPGLITCPEAWPGTITPLPDSVVETAVSEGAILSEAEDGEVRSPPGVGERGVGERGVGERGLMGDFGSGVDNLSIEDDIL